jgi:hypothetical protein
MHPMVMTEIARIRIDERRGEAGARRQPHRDRRMRSAIGLWLVDAGLRIAGPTPPIPSSRRIEVRT